jgi:hypothetical protein
VLRGSSSLTTQRGRERWAGRCGNFPRLSGADRHPTRAFLRKARAQRPARAPRRSRHTRPRRQEPASRPAAWRRDGCAPPRSLAAFKGSRLSRRCPRAPSKPRRLRPPRSRARLPRRRLKEPPRRPRREPRRRLPPPRERPLRRARRPLRPPRLRVLRSLDPPRHRLRLLRPRRPRRRLRRRLLQSRRSNRGPSTSLSFHRAALREPRPLRLPTPTAKLKRPRSHWLPRGRWRRAMSA